jgi:putative ABC transport system permease protein
MNDLFGISMTSIMLVLVALLAISLATVAYVIVRNRIMFFIGLRNIPRRPAQTALIILGLMLSTLIISAAFTTGDTVDHSLTTQGYKLLGHADLWVQRNGEGENAPRDIDSTISRGTVDRLRSVAAAVPEIDGVLPMLVDEVPVINPRSRQSEPTVNLAGIDVTSLDGFSDVVSATTGDQLDVASLAVDEVFMNESAADALATEPGDPVQIYVQGQPHQFTVVDIVKDSLLSGVGDFGALEGVVTRLDTLQQLLERPDEVSFVVISNRGGVRDGLPLTDEVEAGLERGFADAGLSDALEIYDVKRDLIQGFEELGNFMTTFFLIFGLFSIAAGMLLIVMIFVMLAAERKSELGMARAVGTKRGLLVQMFLSEGMAYNVLSAAVGAALGVGVAFGIANVMGRIFADFFNIEPYVTGRSLIISYSLGVVLTFLTVTFASWRVSNLNIVRAIRDIPDPTGGKMSRRWMAVALISLVLGGLLFVLGLNSNNAFSFALGFTLIAAGVAILLRWVGVGERLAFTSICLVLLVVWGFVAGGRLEFLFGPLNGDIEMFFLSGIAMVTAATFILVYNADLVLAVLSRTGNVFGAILPAMKTAVAYPLAARFRTGMTLAMIALVIFALTMMSTMNTNFDRLFLADEARGGWDVDVIENQNNPIADLSAELAAAGSTVQEEFSAVGRLAIPGAASVSELPGDDDYTNYPVVGVDAGFVDGGHVPLSARAKGIASDEEAWQLLKTERYVAIVDNFTLTGGGFGFQGESFHIDGIDAEADEFDPVRLSIRDPITGSNADVRVIGVIDFGASASYVGVYIPLATFQQTLGEPLLTVHLVGLNDPGDAKGVAREIEATLLPLGAQGESIKENIDEDQALSRNFFRLMQGFMGLGLFVGIAAVGVIAFRTVVERRQHIGMLRAIGYKRGTVALSFLLESSFVALLGILAGVSLAIWLSYFLLTSDEFPSQEAGYVVPWGQIVFIGALAFLSSLLMTYVPSRQAASVPIAEALRYE